MGAVDILARGEGVAGTELALSSIEALKKDLNLPLNEFTEDLRKDVLEVFKSGNFHTHKIMFINKALNTLSKTGDSEICNQVGQILLENKVHIIIMYFYVYRLVFYLLLWG